MKHLIGEELEWELERPMFTVYISNYARIYTNNPYFYTLLIFRFNNNMLNVFIGRKTHKSGAEEIIKKVKKEKFTAKLDEFSNQSSKILDRAVAQIENENLHKCSNKRLWELYESWYEVYSNFTLISGVIRISNNAVIKELEKVLKSRSASPQNIMVLSYTPKKSFAAIEEEELIKIAQKYKAGGEEKNLLLQKHFEKWRYLPCGYYTEEPYSEQYFKKRFEELLADKKLASKIDELERKRREEANARKKLIGELELSEEEKNIVDFASEAVFLKEFIRGKMNYSHYINRKFFGEMGRRLDLDWKSVANLFPEQVRKGLLEGEKVVPYKKYVLWYVGNKRYLYVGREADEKIKELNLAKNVAFSSAASASKFEWEWKRNVFPYYLYLFLTQWRECKFSPPVYGCAVYKNKQADMYLNKETRDRAAQTIIKNVKSSGEFLERWKKFVFETGRKVRRFCDNFEKIELKKLSDVGLYSLYLEAFRTYQRHTDGVAVIRNSNRKLQEELLGFCNGNSEYVSELMATSEKSFMLKEREELMEISKAQKAEQESLLKDHAEKWNWISCGYADEKKRVIEDFRKELMEITEKGENIERIEKKREEEAKEREKLIEKLKPPEEVRRLIEFASTCTYFKDFIRGNLNRLQCVTRKIFAEIGNRIGGDWKKVAELTPEEIKKELIEKKKIPEREELVLCSDSKGIHLLLGDDAEKKKRELQQLFQKEVREIKGLGASRGKAKGKVLILTNIEKLGNEKGFVLVSPMTTPDLVPAMRKAVAIVTDEGGLTCHAAIVSRELGIPCIVGTKIATKLLKDGEEVEIDADRGIVKKLN